MALLLAAGAWQAHAEPVSLAFTYTGLHVNRTTVHDLFGTTTTLDEFLPDAQVTGSFSGTDDDGDGVLEMDELDSFVTGTFDYVRCGDNPTRAAMCNFSYFSYVLADGALSFSSGWHGNDEFYSGWGGWTVAGDEAVDYSYDLYSQTTYTLSWTDATRLSVRQLAPPVPEPAGAAMGIAGLVLLGALRRRLH
jgi:MYXO-CTERM domain-containing protein